MKKNLQVILTVLLIWFWFGGISLASNEIWNNCIQEDLWDVTTATICVNGTGWNGIEVTCDDIWCWQGYCYGDKDRSHCPDDLYDDSETTKTIQITFSLEGMLTPYIFRWKFDFQNWMWLKDDSESNSYNYYVNSGYIDISAETSLGAWEPTDLIIKTNKDYIWDIFIKKYKMNSNWIWWRDLNDSVWQKYTMKPSDNWMKILSNFIKLSSVWTYKVEVTNSENQEDSLTFTVHKTYTYIDVEEDDTEENINNEENWDTIKERQEELTKNFNDALNYGKEKNYDKAIEVLKEIVSNEWTIERDNYKIAKEAIRIFEEAIEKNTKKDTPELNKAINRMYENWLTIFNDPESFMAYNWLRRDEASKFFVRYVKEVMWQIPDYSKQWCSFKDLDKAWPDLKDVVVEACQLWLFQWYKWNFMPDQFLTNAQALTVFMRLREWYKDESGSHFANNYYESAHAQWFLFDTPLDNKANFDVNTTRGDVAKMLFRWKN